MKKLKRNVSKDHKRILRPPIDLLNNIFSSVPTKAIARFSCVSKFWSSILRRPDFTELFPTKSLTRPRLLFAFQVGEKLFFTSSLQTPNRDNTSCLVSVHHQTYFPTDYSIEYHHLDGLICLQRPHSTMICNPSKGESLTLPEVSTERIDDKRSHFIGYDPVEQQFKVLCMTQYVSSVHNLPQEHQVMTLGNARHLWRNIKICTPQYPLDKNICINGVLYYLSYISLDSTSTMIVCFDVKSEVFSFINLDAEKHKWLYHSDGTSCTFINYKGRLGLAHLKGRSEKVLELLILEDAAKHKWSHHTYRFSLSWWRLSWTTDLDIVGMTGTCDIVLSPYRLSDPHYVFYYNLDGKTLTRRGFNKGFLDSKTLTRTKVRRFHKESHRRPRVHIFQDYAENVKLSLCNV